MPEKTQHHWGGGGREGCNPPAQTHPPPKRSPGHKAQGEYQTRCGYWGCSVDPFSQFRGNCAHFGGPSHPQSACVPCFCFCNVFCHVPLFVGLLVSKFYCRILSPCLNSSMPLSWLHAGVSVLYTRSTGRTVPATVLAPSASIQSPSENNSDHPETIRK